MGELTGIEWTDSTWNPFIGCAKVSDGCKFCYADAISSRFPFVEWGANGTRVLTVESNWKQPLRWNRKAGEAGVRHKVFVASLADIFEDWKGPMLNNKGEQVFAYGSEWGSHLSVIDGAFPLTMDLVRKRLFAMIDATPNLDWLLLTKRPENIRWMWTSVDEENGRPSHRRNVWLGTTAENQDNLERRMPSLKKCRDLSPVLFLSVEPMVGPVTLWPDAFSDCANFENTVMDPTTGAYECCLKCDYTGVSSEPLVDWVIAGCESGHSRRPANASWFESLAKECAEYEIPFFMKQMEINGEVSKTLSSFPSPVQVRQFPEVSFV